MSADGPQFRSERAFEEIGALKHQVESLKRDVENLKTESRSWIRTWGVYLGILASVFAVPRAAKEAFDSFYQHPKFSVLTPVPLTLFYDTPHQKLTFSFPVLASNYGNRGGVIVGATAHFEPPPMNASDPQFKFVDDTRHAVDIPFPVPVGVSKSVVGSVAFTGSGLILPGRHRLNVTLIGDDQKPLPMMPMQFCFEINDELTAVISQEPQRLLNTPCD
ncbi:MAG TPA: hypothetical protein VE083_05570 [Terriglobales bacterium]|nr:hypothetical protein [Terriglobales bacterium]